MNEKQVIAKLRKLKQVQPHPSVLSTLKKEIDHGLQLRENDARSQRYGWSDRYFSVQSKYLVKGLFLAVMIVIIFLLSFLVFPRSLHTLSLQTRLALAANHYEKAAITFYDTASQYKKVDKENGENFSKTLAFTNTQLSELKLKGESGKYTAEECRDLYKKYLAYLQKIYSSTPHSLPQLKSQISSYEELAEKKLSMYDHL